MEKYIFALMMILSLAFPTFTYAGRDYDISKMKEGELPPFGTNDRNSLAAWTKNEVLFYNIANRVMALIERGNGKPVIRKKTAPFLVRIQSSYYDEGTKKWNVVQGLGSLVGLKIGDREYSGVLSVSHLTQGQQLRIYDGNGELLPILPGYRYANIDEDVEIILLKDRVETSLNYVRSSNSKVGFFSSTIFDLTSGVMVDGLEVTPWDRIYVAPKQHVPILRSNLPQGSQGIAKYSWSDSSSRAILQLHKRRDLRGVELLKAAWDETGVLQKQFLGHGYIANAIMPPGLSGAPLIRDVPLGIFLEDDGFNYIIDGLVQGHHRFQKKSYFVGRESIRLLVNAFQDGKRGYTSQTRWRLRDGMTFRDYGNGVIETNFVKTPSSSFFKGESGNAISVDGDFGQDNAFGVGMQTGHNTVVVGKYVQFDGKTLPVLMDPQLDKLLPENLTATSTFGPKQDLLQLAKLKYEFRDQIASTNSSNFKCIYNVSDVGIRLQVYDEKKSINWSRDKQSLQAGFAGNQMIIQDKKTNMNVEISGLFFTDLSSLPDFDSPAVAGAPSVSVFASDLDEPKRVSCFESLAERERIFKEVPFMIMIPEK